MRLPPWQQRGGNGPENALITVAAVVSNIKLAKGNSPACPLGRLDPFVTLCFWDMATTWQMGVSDGGVYRYTGIPKHCYITISLINRETSEKPLDIHWILEGPNFQNPGPTRTAQPEVSSWTPCLSFKAMDPFDPFGLLGNVNPRSVSLRQFIWVLLLNDDCCRF